MGFIAKLLEKYVKKSVICHLGKREDNKNEKNDEKMDGISAKLTHGF